MPIDEALLASHRAFRDPRTGISEEFMQPTLGSGMTVAVLTRPPAAQSSVGWVICHSFGMEQLHLGRLDVLAARALGAAGYPVLRYHGQGYGDSEGDMRTVGLSSHLAEAADAVDLMSSQAGVGAVGVMGARFGATVAALTAEARRLPFLVLWEPVVKGSQFMRDFIRSRLFMEVAGGTGDAAGAEQLRKDLESTGMADIKGFPLSKATHDEVAAVDLTRDIVSFRGSVLVIGVSRSGKLAPGAAKLAEHLRTLGVDCEVEVREDPRAAQFGQYHYNEVSDQRAKTDTMLDLSLAIADATVAWCRRVTGVEAPVGGTSARPPTEAGR